MCGWVRGTGNLSNLPAFITPNYFINLSLTSEPQIAQKHESHWIHWLGLLAQWKGKNYCDLRDAAQMYTNDQCQELDESIFRGTTKGNLAFSERLPLVNSGEKIPFANIFCRIYVQWNLALRSLRYYGHFFSVPAKLPIHFLVRKAH